MFNNNFKIAYSNGRILCIALSHVQKIKKSKSYRRTSLLPRPIDDLYALLIHCSIDVY